MPVSILGRADRKANHSLPREIPTRGIVELYSCEWHTALPRFGKGLLASRPSHRLPCTVADHESTGALFSDYHTDNAWDQMSDADYDAMALRFEQMVALENGHVG